MAAIAQAAACGLFNFTALQGSASLGGARFAGEAAVGGQGFGLAVPSEFLSMLPYLATIAVLVFICRNPQTILLNKPIGYVSGQPEDDHLPAVSLIDHDSQYRPEGGLRFKPGHLERFSIDDGLINHIKLTALNRA